VAQTKTTMERCGGDRQYGGDGKVKFWGVTLDGHCSAPDFNSLIFDIFI
jgi:hypothetical protein